MGTENFGADGGTAPTAKEVARLNARAVTRGAAVARLAGTALIAAGVVAEAAWGWFTYRLQDELRDAVAVTLGVPNTSLGTASHGVGLADRLDAMAMTIELAVLGMLAIALGVAIRLFATYTVARAGGTPAEPAGTA
jgi:hypothetical protein